jgi:hypothetical protein
VGEAGEREGYGCSSNGSVEGKPHTRSKGRRHEGGRSAGARAEECSSVALTCSIWEGSDGGLGGRNGQFDAGCV